MVTHVQIPPVHTRYLLFHVNSKNPYLCLMPRLPTTPQRSYNMSRIRAEDTKPELLLRKALWAKGIRYRTHAEDLLGRPDTVIRKYRLASSRMESFGMIMPRLSTWDISCSAFGVTTYGRICKLFIRNTGTNI